MKKLSDKLSTPFDKASLSEQNKTGPIQASKRHSPFKETMDAGKQGNDKGDDSKNYVESEV